MCYRGVCESKEERVVRGNRLSLGGGTSHQFGATSASTSFLCKKSLPSLFGQRTLGALKDSKSVFTTTPFSTYCSVLPDQHQYTTKA